MISIIRAVGNWTVPLIQLVFLLGVVMVAEQVGKGELNRAILYGGVVSVLNLLWLQWRLRRSERRHPAEEIEQDAGQSARKIAADLYITAAERLTLVSALLLLGMLRLQLDPMALIIGFIAGQLAMLLGSWYLAVVSSARV